MEAQPTGITARRRGRTILVVMFCCSLFPVMLAWLVFFYGQTWIPAATTNEGTLVHPPIRLARATAIEDLPGGRWLLLVMSENSCDESCRRALYFIRQVNLALGKDMDRVDRLLLGSLSLPEVVELQQLYPKLRLLSVDRSRLEEAFQNSGDLRPDASLIYLADPLGNIMMYYLPEQFGKPILDDLRHLLKVSNIG